MRVPIAVLLPCLNEGPTVAATVAAFRAALPDATIFVYDNGSSDETAARATEAGAVVQHVEQRGKGNVVRRMFADVDADLYVMADGDNTYDASAAGEMVKQLVDRQLDMIVGRRTSTDDAAYRAGHQLGNRLITGSLRWLFGAGFSDALSGYRVFSRRFVKSFPVMSRGFEIETELTVHALTLGLPAAEVATRYGARPAGSTSKLSTFGDGFRIARRIFDLWKNERPLMFFSLLAALVALVALALAAPLFVTYAETGLVPRFPTAILAASLMLLAFLSFIGGLVLDAVAHGRREQKRLAYLQVEAPQRRASNGSP